MTPYEVMLSESQERMLVVARAGREEAVIGILNKWELEAAVIGHVTDDGLYRVRHDGDVVCEIPGEPLVTGCPTYVREAREALVAVTGPELEELWSLRMGEQVLFTAPRGEVVRGHLNHLIHHRAHLCVYLRLNDVPVPGMYHPSGDE